MVRRWLRRLGLLIVIVISAAVAATAWRLWRALPDLQGTLALPGLRQRATIVRDADAVPHIRASSEADALFALGYVHAQDRLWQMEFQRRLAAGELSAILGPDALETDRMMRTIGFDRAARASLPALDAATRALVDAYVAGVNAHLAKHRGARLPIEFALLRYEPAPWRAEDVIAWQKVMGWSMSTNWREELLRERLAGRVGEKGAAQLLPVNVAGAPIVLPSFIPPIPRPPDLTGSPSPGARPHVIPGSRPRLAPLPFEPASGGSNNWVIGGARSATGRPLLANDPHLGVQAPSVWYVAHLTGGPLDVIGATLPGTPAVVIGHNGRIAWGITNMMTDVEDLYLERINDRDEAEVDGRWEPMQILHETIAVRGGPAVPLRIRLTRHGPLISDVLEDEHALALRWTGHDPADRTAQAYLRLNRARSWDEFVAAFADYQLPMLNFVYADVDGNIGYVGPGALPLRTGDGTLPLDGSLTSNDWRGYVAAGELPRALNPREGFIASANNQVVPDSYPYTLSTSWEAPYRAARITSAVAALSRATIDDMKRLQNDQRSMQPSRILPFLMRASPQSAPARAALEQLKSWDNRIAGDSGAAALFEAYYIRAAWRLFSDDLGVPLWNDYRRLTSVVAKAFEQAATDPATRWCDDVRTGRAETCPEILGDALEVALEDLRVAQGTGDPARWRWDRQNDVWFPHLPFHASRLLRPFFSRHVRRGGDAFTVNPSMPFRDEMLVASYRQIIDLADLDRSLFILPLGQSGHLLSGRYSDMLTDWNAGRYRPLRFSRAAVDASATHTLTLTPGR